MRGTPGHGSAPFKSDNALMTAAAVMQRIGAYRPAPRFHELWRTQVDSLGVDGHGNVCVASMVHAGISIVSPKGDLVRFVDIDVDGDPGITNITWGGPDMRTAFVASASKTLTDEERRDQPHAGGLFTFRVDVPGLAQPGFGG